MLGKFSLIISVLILSTLANAIELDGIEIKSFKIEKDILESISNQKDFGIKKIYLNRSCKSHFGEGYRSVRVVSRDYLIEGELPTLTRLYNALRTVFGFSKTQVPRELDIGFYVLCAKSNEQIELSDELSNEYIKLLDEEDALVNNNVEVNDTTRKNSLTPGNSKTDREVLIEGSR